MKIMHEQIDFPGLSPVKVKYREIQHFTYPWHFHAEFELLYVIEGHGVSFVADNIEEFKSGDLVLLGSNLPHFWRSENRYFERDPKLKVKYIVIQFPSDLLKEQIDNYPEFHLIGELLDKTARGIRYSPEFVLKIKKTILKITKKTGLERFVLLIELLQTLAKTKHYRLLAGELYKHQDHDFSSDRLTKVMHFLNTNYQQKIELSKVAEIANLNPSAFCRFFKEKTSKTLTEFINDMRVSYACKLIIDGKLSISQVCYNCGFNNLSNFNRIFKKHTGYPPTKYHQLHHAKVKKR